MKRLEHYAEVVVTLSVLLSILLCGVLYFIVKEPTVENAPAQAPHVEKASG